MSAPAKVSILVLDEADSDEVSRALTLGVAYADVLRRMNLKPAIPPDDDWEFLKKTHAEFVAAQKKAGW